MCSCPPGRVACAGQLGGRAYQQAAQGRPGPYRIRTKARQRPTARKRGPSMLLTGPFGGRGHDRARAAAVADLRHRQLGRPSILPGRCSLPAPWPPCRADPGGPGHLLRRHRRRPLPVAGGHRQRRGRRLAGGQAAHARSVLDGLGPRAPCSPESLSCAATGPPGRGSRPPAGRVPPSPGRRRRRARARRARPRGRARAGPARPGAMAGATHRAIDWYVPSPDGRHAACGVSKGGSERSTLHLVETATGRLLDDTSPGRCSPS